MKNSGKNSDSPDTRNAELEVVLKGLCDAQPAPGMEGRLLAALADRPIAARRARRRRWLPLLPPSAGGALSLRRSVWGLYAVAVVLLALSVAFVSRREIAPRAAPGVQAAHDARRAIGTTAAIATGCIDRPARAPLGSSPRPHAPQPGRKPALAEDLAVSYPAPPMPLTAQEELLLRVAHGRDLQQSALLNPSLRASVDDARQEEFHRFFIAATTLRNEESPN